MKATPELLDDLFRGALQDTIDLPQIDAVLVACRLTAEHVVTISAVAQRWIASHPHEHRLEALADLMLARAAGHTQENDPKPYTLTYAHRAAA